MNSLFFLFSTGAWISAAMVIQSKNPVHSVFFLVLVFFNTSAIRFLCGLEFFALLTLLVYVGALAIMFLFVVMLLDIQVTEVVESSRGYYPISLLFTLLLCTVVIFYLDFSVQTGSFFPYLSYFSADFIQAQNSGSFYESLESGVSHNTAQLENYSSKINWPNLLNSESTLAAIGYSLYIINPDLLIIASLLLRVAMLGAVVLTLKKRVNTPAHDIFTQQNLDFKRIVYTIKF